MKTLLRFTAETALALIMGTACFGQRYTPNQSCFKCRRSRSRHRSSVDQSLGHVSQSQQCVVGVRPKDRF